MEGRRAQDLTKNQKIAALKYLMFLKQKRCGRIKGRGCADGRKQRLYKSKEETSSPTMTIEALFLTCIVDAMERRCVVTCDIPGAFMQTDIDESVHVKMEGELATLLVKIEPSYKQFLYYERGKPVIYAELTKALYGTVQAAYLWWQDLSGFLKTQGFAQNPYDPCVMNKQVDGNQCTVGWHVDDLKISHVKQSVCESMVDALQSRYGKEAPLTVTRGKVHEYLGMTIDYSVEGKVKFSMKDYMSGLITEAPAELTKREASTPAANHLFEINDNATKLDKDKSEMFHHLTAKLLYLSKRTRPDIQLPVSFLTTRVQYPDEDDWKKLGRCLSYLKKVGDLPLTLEADNMSTIKWWVDASFAVHKDFKSHTGATMTMGKGCPINMSKKQQIMTRSSTEAELVGVNDALTMVIWIRNFLEAQGFVVKDNVVHQDNQSAILLENNGQRSSGKRTRHIEIRYYFITDNINRGRCSVTYCPTEQMVGDFFTKPLQGTQFRKFRDLIMNM